VAGPVDLSEVHLALDRLRPQICHCGLKGECLGCKGVEMVRAQVEAVAAAASQPVLIQVAQETAMKDMASRFQSMSERLLSDPEIRRSAEQMQERLMADPETRQLLEELMRRLGGGALPPDELN
jgi:D-alanyl-D-alanine dipeptidase